MILQLLQVVSLKLHRTDLLHCSDADILQHDELPTIKTTVAPNDKVIGGYLYNNVLLLAPDADTYAKIVSQHA